MNIGHDPSYNGATIADRELIERVNDTTRQYPHSRCIHDLVTEHAKRRPQAVAITDGDHVLTYGELDERANKLAWALRQRAVQVDGRVAVCLQRSREVIVALLGILKAGAAYVPLEVSYPESRIRFMLKDAGVDLVVTEVATSAAFGGVPQIILDADDDAMAVAAQPTSPPPVTTAAENLAYVIYTSGSTGTPKGVAVHHRGVVRLVTSPTYGDIGTDDVLLQVSPLAFDASTFEIWGALINGARLVLLESGLPSPDTVAATVEAEGVNTLLLVTGLFHRFTPQHLNRMRSLRRLIVGGDVLSPARARDFLRCVPECRLLNGYGPTETTTMACFCTIETDEQCATSVPIGQPVQNTSAYVLGDRMQMLGVGSVGELFLGGDGLARGYLGASDLTAAVFVPNPIGIPGSRLYKTGDRVRWRPDGALEFVGRIDSQVKVRGYRIEIGEVELALRRQPGVKDAAAAIVGDAADDKRLVAYVAPREVVYPDHRMLLARLVEELPEYMIPTLFVGLDELPQTAHGKVDRKALPPPHHISSTYEAPHAGLEERLAQIWRQVLSVEHVSRHDAFFDMGGHSLLAMRLASGVQKELGVRLPLRLLYEHPTLAELAPQLAAAHASDSTCHRLETTPPRKLGNGRSSVASTVGRAVGWPPVEMLAAFTEVQQPTPEAFRTGVRASGSEVVLFCQREWLEPASTYARRLGCEARTRVVSVKGPLTVEEIEGVPHGTLPLVVNCALDPSIREEFFGHPQIITFLDHHYVDVPDHESPLLLTIGSTERVIRELPQVDVPRDSDFTSLLQSALVERIVLHALGPDGTNISQACRLYMASNGIEEKTDLVIHPRGIEPRAYAELARRERRDGVLPLHMECAVYYELRDLFLERPTEVVFADQQYMRLDTLQLARRPGAVPPIDGPRALRLASHPSPVGLVRPWLEAGMAIHIKATSTTAAAVMVRDGEADICITTASGCRNNGLEVQFEFGSPMMIFTIGAAVDRSMLKRFRASPR